MRAVAEYLLERTFGVALFEEVRDSSSRLPFLVRFCHLICLVAVFVWGAATAWVLLFVDSEAETIIALWLAFDLLLFPACMVPAWFLAIQYRRMPRLLEDMRLSLVDPQALGAMLIGRHTEIWARWILLTVAVDLGAFAFLARKDASTTLLFLASCVVLKPLMVWVHVQTVHAAYALAITLVPSSGGFLRGVPAVLVAAVALAVLQAVCLVLLGGGFLYLAADLLPLWLVGTVYGPYGAILVAGIPTLLGYGMIKRFAARIAQRRFARSFGAAPA